MPSAQTDIRTERELAREIGRRVAAARDHAGISQQELAGALDVEVKQVRAVERGSTVLPLLEVIRFATVIGCDPAVLMRGLRHRAALADRRELTRQDKVRMAFTERVDALGAFRDAHRWEWPDTTTGLGRWLSVTRQRVDLSPEQIEMLDAVAPGWETYFNARTCRRLAELEEFLAKFGRYPKLSTPGEESLALWVQKKRAEHRKGR